MRLGVFVVDGCLHCSTNSFYCLMNSSSVYRISERLMSQSIYTPNNVEMLNKTSKEGKLRCDSKAEIEPLLFNDNSSANCIASGRLHRVYGKDEQSRLEGEKKRRQAYPVSVAAEQMKQLFAVNAGVFRKIEKIIASGKMVTAALKAELKNNGLPENWQLMSEVEKEAKLNSVFC